MTQIPPSDDLFLRIKLEIGARELESKRHCSEGNKHHDAGCFEDAIESYDVALKINPNHMESLANRASSYVAVSNFDGAITDCSKIIKIKDDEKNELREIFYTRAEAYYHSKQYYNALSDCDECLRLSMSVFSVDFIEARALRGAIHNCLGNWSSAICDLSVAIGKRNNFFDALVQRGMSYMQTMELNLATIDLNTALKMSPESEQLKKLLEQVNDTTEKLQKEAEDALLNWHDANHTSDSEVNEKRTAVNALKNKRKKAKKKKRRRPNLVRVGGETNGEEIEQAEQIELEQEEISTNNDPLVVPTATPPVLRESKEKTSPLPRKPPPPIDTTKHVSFDESHNTEETIEPRSGGVHNSLQDDFFSIEVAAIVDTVIAVGTASVLGRHHKVSEQMCFAVALQMQQQTKIGLLRALREQYIEVRCSRQPPAH